MSSPPDETPRTQQRRRKQPGATNKRITKEEKIFQLKSALKISKEENSRLTKENERLRNNHLVTSSINDNNNTSTNGNKVNNSNGDQQKKFREAMRALKQVTVSQEKNIKALRTKAQQRRKEIKERDARIAKLQQKVKSLETAETVVAASRRGGGGEGVDLETKYKELLVLYDQEKQKNNDLEEVLDLREAQMETVQKQRNSLLAPKLMKKSNTNNNNKSSDNASLGSVSTNADFDAARLKTELARKSEKINKLEMDLEIIKDELHEYKRRGQGCFASLGGIGSPFFGQSSFHVGGGAAAGDDDDWTEADTDYDESESDFGNSQFFFGSSDSDKFGVGSTVGDAIGSDSFFKNKTHDEEENQHEFDFW